MKTTTASIAVFLLALTLGSASCSRNAAARSEALALEATTVQLQPGEYPAAFAAARDVIRDMGFMLERVDAQAGVITTQPKGTAGFATPWDREQTSAGQEVEDFLQRNRRMIRIDAARRSAAATDQPAVDAGDTADFRTISEPLELRVSVEVSRIHTSGRRINTGSITDSTYARDPDLESRNMSTYAVSYAQEPDLGAKIASRIRERMASAKPQN